MIVIGLGTALTPLTTSGFSGFGDGDVLSIFRVLLRASKTSYDCLDEDSTRLTFAQNAEIRFDVPYRSVYRYMGDTSAIHCLGFQRLAPIETYCWDLERRHYQPFRLSRSNSYENPTQCSYLNLQANSSRYGLLRPVLSSCFEGSRIWLEDSTVFRV